MQQLPEPLPAGPITAYPQVNFENIEGDRYYYVRLQTAPYEGGPPGFTDYIFFTDTTVPGWKTQFYVKPYERFSRGYKRVFTSQLLVQEGAPLPANAAELEGSFMGNVEYTASFDEDNIMNAAIVPRIARAWAKMPYAVDDAGEFVFEPWQAEGLPFPLFMLRANIDPEQGQDGYTFYAPPQQQGGRYRKRRTVVRRRRAARKTRKSGRKAK